MIKRIFINATKHLPVRIRHALLHLAFNIDNDEFMIFAHRYAFAPNMRLCLESFRSRGADPKHIVDVGAYHGEWSNLAASVWPDAQITMVEPQHHLAEALHTLAEHTGYRFHEALLGAHDGVLVDFNVMESGSSILPEHSNVHRRVESRTLQTLDSLLMNEAVQVDLLKIDAEGYELEILNGALQVLEHVSYVLLEVSLIATNEGCPLIHKVLAFMRGHDFVAYDIFEFHRRPLDHALNKIDILFIRVQSGLRADLRHSS